MKAKFITTYQLLRRKILKLVVQPLTVVIHNDKLSCKIYLSATTLKKRNMRKILRYKYCGFLVKFIKQNSEDQAETKIVLNSIKMRFIIALCFSLVVAYAEAGPIDEPMTGMFLYATEGDVKSADGESVQLESELNCTIGLCIDLCLAYGFRPPFTAQCINPTTCRCTQL